MSDRDLKRAEIVSAAKLKTIEQIARFISNGGGTFRVFCCEVGLAYEECYKAGGMAISNTIDKGLHGPLPSEEGT